MQVNSMKTLQVIIKLLQLIKNFQMFLDDSRWRVFDPSGWQKYFHLLPQDVNLYAEGIP